MNGLDLKRFLVRKRIIEHEDSYSLEHKPQLKSRKGDEPYWMNIKEDMGLLFVINNNYVTVCSRRIKKGAEDREYIEYYDDLGEWEDQTLKIEKDFETEDGKRVVYEIRRIQYGIKEVIRQDLEKFLLHKEILGIINIVQDFPLVQIDRYSNEDRTYYWIGKSDLTLGVLIILYHKPNKVEVTHLVNLSNGTIERVDGEMEITYFNFDYTKPLEDSKDEKFRELMRNLVSQSQH